MTASLELPTARYDGSASKDFYRRAAERVRALPGVDAVAFSSDLPWSGYDENTSFSIVGRQFPDREGPRRAITSSRRGIPGPPARRSWPAAMWRYRTSRRRQRSWS